MRIEIWSDVVCPWCYIGKRRLEEALEAFPQRDEVEIVWRSYQLDPTAPKVATESIASALGRKYGGGEDAGRQMVEQMQQVAQEVGLDYTRYPEAKRVSTVDAHRLLHAAGARRPELKEALLQAYFVEARNVADHDELVAIASEVGLAEDDVRRVLGSDEHLTDVEEDIDAAQDLGAQGVPFFVIDRRLAISGAQPVEVFARALEQARAAASPLTAVGGAAEDGSSGVCGPDGCS
ncbi:MAG: disulfide bond formation protein DsbA [Pimelobacter sp.]|nr:disulfide bond formation protein DsbA [Pimelobacter sp.]